MHVFPAWSENVPLLHMSHDVLPSVLDQPAGQDAHTRVPLMSNVPGAQARVELQTPSMPQSTAIHPGAMATEEDPPAAMEPALGLLQLVFPSFFWSHPLGQLAHVVIAGAPSTSEKRPGLHGLHPKAL
jgi:hypothetical protein